MQPVAALDTGWVNHIIRHMPFNMYCGLHCTAVHDDGLTLAVDLKPELLNGQGVLHGGVYATLADAAIGLALYRHFGGIRRMATTELKINYFRPVAAGALSARAKILRVGAHLCTGQVDLLDGEGNLAGVSIATYMLLA
jgi:acyl-CoA thioesterase